MRIVLLSGGSGKRLWPLSNDNRSKQFLKILPAEDGTRISMVQRVWGQLQLLGLHEKTIVSTSESQQDLLRTQLGSPLQLVLEPNRKDTFPAIALACAYLHTTERVDPQEPVVIMPVDSYVEAEFFEKLIELPELLTQTKCNLALLGVNPLHPSEKYGYIVPQGKPGTEQAQRVSRFVEKPATGLAARLIEEGALWNCGVFAFRLEYILSILEAQGLPTDYSLLLAHYPDLTSRSFDYEVVEREPLTAVLKYDGHWKDLGTWSTLTEEMASPIHGNGHLSEDSHRSSIINELGIPVLVLGLEDAVVAAGPEGILVSTKEASVRLKDMIKSIPADRPRYRETSYGWSCVIDKAEIRHGLEAVTRRIHVAAGGCMSHKSGSSDEWIIWSLIGGTGTLRQDGTERPIGLGEVLHLHETGDLSIIAGTDLNLIEVRHEKRRLLERV